MFEDEKNIFNEFLKKKNLKRSDQRERILDIFLSTERHMTADELYSIVKNKHPEVGFSTIYRTLRLICDSGLGNELILNDSAARYEHSYGHKHHDHLICERCGRVVEIIDPDIEKLQEKIARKEGFILTSHRLLLYGKCSGCRK